MLDVSFKALHILGAVAYVGGAVMLHGPLRRALRLIPPGQAAIVGSRVGGDFTLISWLCLALLGASGYAMAWQRGLTEMSPATLWISPSILETREGMALLVMVAGWYLVLCGAAIITFVLRPRLALRIGPNASAESATRAVATIAQADRWLDAVALTNLVIATLALLAGAFLH